MSEANVEVVRDLIHAFNVRDEPRAREIFAPDVVMFAPEGWPEAGPERGVDAVVGQFDRLADDWESFAVTILSEETTAESVLLRLNWRAKSASTGLAFEMELSGVYRFQDGRVVEVTFFWEHDEALDAAGLRR